MRPITRLTSYLPSIDRVPTGSIYRWGRERTDAYRGLTARKVVGILGLGALAAVHVIAAKAGYEHGELHRHGMEDTSILDTAKEVYDYAYAAGHAAIALVQTRLAGNLFLDRAEPEPLVECRTRDPLPIVADVASTVVSQAVFMLT